MIKHSKTLTKANISETESMHNCENIVKYSSAIYGYRDWFLIKLTSIVQHICQLILL